VTEQERIVTEQERSLAISTRSRPHAVRKTQSVCAVVPSPRGGLVSLASPKKVPILPQIEIVHTINYGSFYQVVNIQHLGTNLKPPTWTWSAPSEDWRWCCCVSGKRMLMRTWLWRVLVR